jgi:putative acetyltransferase
MTINNLSYQPISPLREDVRYLIGLLNEHHLSHCPPEICHLAPAEQLAEQNCVMIGAFDQNKLCGMGTVKFFDDYAEITRMFVLDEYRGNRIAGTILNQLIELAKDRNLSDVKLETSDKFEAAVNLYYANGFEICGPFGEYLTKAQNMYMQKKLRQD